jgi:hypothetical protein
MLVTALLLPPLSAWHSTAARLCINNLLSAT